MRRESEISGNSGISAILRQPVAIKLSRQIPEKITFNIEMFKHGRTFNSLKKRWAILIRDVGLFSSKDPDVTKFVQGKCKDKTSFLLNSNVKSEKLTDQKDWSVPKKPFRLVIENEDQKKKNKKDYLFLYFEDDLQINQCKEMLFAIKSITKDEKGNRGIVTSLKTMQKVIEGSFLFYGVSKLLQVKQKVKQRKIILNSMKANFSQSLDPFINFTRTAVGAIIKNSSSSMNQNKQISILFPKFKFLHCNQSSKYNNNNSFKTLSFLKNKVNFITSIFPEFFSKKKVNRLNSSSSVKNKNILSKFAMLGSINKAVAFKLINTEFKSYGADNLVNFDGRNFKSLKTFTINKNKIEIKFNDKCALTRDDILNISNIFVNYKTSANSDNSNFIILNGPKLDNSKYFKFNYKNLYLPFLAHEKFVEPAYHCMSYTQSNDTKFKSLYFQIFHSIFVFKQRDFDYLEALSDKIKFTHTIEDFYFFLSISLNGKFKLRTKLVKAKQYENERFIIEFNLEHVLNLDSLNIFTPLEIKISLNIIPVQCFNINGKASLSSQPVLVGDEINKLNNNKDQIQINPDMDVDDFGEWDELKKKQEQEKILEKQINFYVDYLKPYEMGFCTITNENINKRDYEYALCKERVCLSEENKLIMNFFIDEKNTYQKSQSKFYGKSFNYGNEIFSLETINKKSISPRMNDPKIDNATKEKLYNIKFAEDGCILLRCPDGFEINSQTDADDEEEFLSKLREETNITPNELSGIIHNKNYKFIPQVYCEKSIDIDEDYVDLESWKYKTKNVKTFLLGNFKGITENQCFVYHNYFYNEIMTCRLDDVSNEINKKFKPIQENLFDIYDFAQVDQTTIENGDNYLWKIGLNFVNENEKKAFLVFLKDLRRRANLTEKNEKIIINSPISTNILTALTKNDLSSVKSLKIILDKIEFRQNFVLNENKKMSIKISKTTNEMNLGRYILETFEENEKYNYCNSLIDDKEICENLKVIQNLRKGFKILPKVYSLIMKEFNESHKILNFGENVELKDKLFDVEIKPGIDKLFNLEIVLEGAKSTNILSSIKNFDNIINARPQADFFIIPLLDSETKIVYAILHAKILVENPNENLSFDEFINKNIKNIPMNNEKLIKDEYDNYIKFGKYEPNVYKRSVLRIIHSYMKNDINSICKLPEFDTYEYREKLHSLLKKKYIRNCDSLLTNNYQSELWKELVIDNSLRQNKLMRKFYFINKRNEFYKEFAKVEWDLFFRKVFTTNLQNKEKSLVYENIRNIHSLIPNKLELINLKIKKNYLYNGLRFLFYIGLPIEERLQVWERILDIENLVILTRDGLKLKRKLIKEDSQVQADFNPQIEKTENLKIEIYEYFKTTSKDNTKFNINFSLIENDLNFLHKISDSELNFNAIKDIAKAFFLWAELNITTDKYVRGSGSENKYVYFFGLLKIIQKLYSVFKNECQTFWIIVGLSQILELFYQSNPLYTEDLTYTKMYVLITKLVMENNLKNLYHKFVELGFPIEYFFAKLIPTLYCDLFQTELFLRLLDIIIFEAALKTNNYDRYDYLRVICTIPLTLVKFNEKKIMECRNVKEMDIVFEDLHTKAFNHQRFLEALRENRGKFFEMKNFLERFVEINENTSWDIKRNRIQNKLELHFAKVLEENKKYLKGFENNKISIGDKFIGNFEDEIRGRLQSIRKAYSMSETSENEINNNLNSDNESVISDAGYKTGIYFLVSNFYSYDADHSADVNKPDKLFMWTEYNKKVIYLDGFKDRVNTPTLILELDYNNQDSGSNIKDSMKNIISQQFREGLPKFFNILLKNEESTLIGQYVLNIKQLDLMRSYKLKLESINQMNKTVLEICIIKFSNEKVPNEDCDLFNVLFSEPNYVFDNELESEVNGLPVPSEEEIEEWNKQIISTNLSINTRLTKLLKIKEKFIYEEFKKNGGGVRRNLEEEINVKNSINASNNQVVELNPKLKEIIKNLFTVPKDGKDDNNNSNSNSILVEWLNTNDSTFEEVLYAIVLVDPSSITIYEKLKLIYDIAKTKNYLIFKEDTLPVAKLKEMVYCLYKRYMVYFTKYDIDRLVDYVLNSENFTSYKFAGVYNNDKSKAVENIVYDEDHVSTSVLSIFKKEEKLFLDIKRHLVYVSNIFRNQFNLNSLPISMINSANSYLFGEGFTKEKNFNKLRIDIETDNIRKIKILNIENNQEKSKLQITDPSNSNPNNNVGDPFESILKKELNSIELSNNNTNHITFDKFKDVFFNLPFIPDLIRASCGFYTYNPKQENFIRIFETVKIELSFPDDYISRNFIFTENFVKKYF